MKKILFFISLIITNFVVGQNRPITPEEFFSKNHIGIADMFPKEIAPGKVDESMFYLFESPLIEDGYGNPIAGVPNLLDKYNDVLQGYVVRGGVAVRCSATITSGPTHSGAWKAKFNQGKGILYSADRTSVAYSDPKVFKAFQIGYMDDYGATHVRYELHL